MGTKQVQHMQPAVFGMEVCCQKDERADHMLHLVLVDSRLSVGYLNRVSFEEKINAFRASKESSPAQAMLQHSRFELQLYFHALMFREDSL